MALIVEKSDGIAIVRLNRENLDAGNEKEFKREVHPALESNSKIVFDMTGVRFVDSAGLGALLSCLRQLNAAGGDLKLCEMAKHIRALFELARMHRVFEIFNTRDEAVLSFRH